MTCCHFYPSITFPLEVIGLWYCFGENKTLAVGLVYLYLPSLSKAFK